MMDGLIPDAGKWRSGNVGILKGSALSHTAPKADRVPTSGDLLRFLRDEETHPLIREHQRQYYAALEASDRSGDSTAFVHFSLGIIQRSLEEFFSSFAPKPLTLSGAFQDDLHRHRQPGLETRQR